MNHGSNQHTTQFARKCGFRSTSWYSSNARSTDCGQSTMSGLNPIHFENLRMSNVERPSHDARFLGEKPRAPLQDPLGLRAVPSRGQQVARSSQPRTQNAAWAHVVGRKSRQQRTKRSACPSFWYTTEKCSSRSSHHGWWWSRTRVLHRARKSWRRLLAKESNGALAPHKTEGKQDTEVQPRDHGHKTGRNMNVGRAK